MVFRVTLENLDATPLALGCLTLNDRMTGASFDGYSDGNGFMDIDTEADGDPRTVPVREGDLLVLSVNGYKIQKSSNNDPRGPFYYVVTAAPVQTITLSCSGFKKPFLAAPRYWNGVNMCGVRIDGLPPIPGGAADASLFMSWFYDRYPVEWRRKIRAIMKARGKLQWLVSWPDSRAMGYSVDQFLDFCQELIDDGFFPAVMLTSKDYDRDPNNKGYLTDANAAAIIQNLLPVLPAMVGRLPIFCEGWELGDWWRPEQLQPLIDQVAPVVLSQVGTLNYVHLGQGKGSWQPDGKSVADFWNVNIGKLTGLLHERIMFQSRHDYYYGSGGLVDMLIRFAGNFFCSPNSGFNHPFDLVALEITAQEQFNGTMSEAEGDSWNVYATNAPPQSGPAGLVGMMGASN